MDGVCSRTTVSSDGWSALRAPLGHRHYGSAHTTMQDDSNREALASERIDCLVGKRGRLPSSSLLRRSCSAGGWRGPSDRHSRQSIPGGTSSVRSPLAGRNPRFVNAGRQAAVSLNHTFAALTRPRPGSRPRGDTARSGSAQRSGAPPDGGGERATSAARPTSPSLINGGRTRPGAIGNSAQGSSPSRKRRILMSVNEQSMQEAFTNRDPARTITTMQLHSSDCPKD